ncbi:hypothetical protein CVV72_17395 [Amycolatopsis sp. TNS106]|nr:hypothetical protein CVV72_17395 [Amycolatopsis sp. TNS106]
MKAPFTALDAVKGAFTLLVGGESVTAPTRAEVREVLQSLVDDRFQAEDDVVRQALDAREAGP